MPPASPSRENSYPHPVSSSNGNPTLHIRKNSAVFVSIPTNMSNMGNGNGSSNGDLGGGVSGSLPGNPGAIGNGWDEKHGLGLSGIPGITHHDSGREQRIY